MAVAKADNMVIFVPYVVPGDVVDIRIIKKKKSFAEGRAIKFHSYYNKNRVITEDPALSRARLFLVKSIGQVLRNALGILGVSAPEKM